MLDPSDKDVSLERQCKLLGISLSSYYYKRKQETDENLRIMEQMDKQYTSTPFYGVLRMQSYISSLGYKVNVKRIRRLMRLMGLDAIYCKPNLSKPDKAHKKFPYLLRGIKPERNDQVWSMDITYIPMEHGFMYLTAIIDWHSRYILSWRLSNTLDGAFCRECLAEALSSGQPAVFNTDQGTQFTCEKFQGVLAAAKGVQVSMDGKGRALDNVYIERFWRTIKYEYVYLHTQTSVKELYDGIAAYIEFYNKRRPHQSLGNKTPYEVYTSKGQKESDDSCLKQAS